MAASETRAHPIRSLRGHIARLEAAIAVCLGDPSPGAVHQLRTTSRRVEAHLQLLALLPDLPEHAKSAAKARRLLGKLRRAAGQVRDLDVQRDLLQPIRQGDARDLRRHLKHQRKPAAAHLLHVLERTRPAPLEKLRRLLDSAASTALSATQLSNLAKDWFARQTANIDPQTESDEDCLHAIRKAAKIARYIAESAPKPHRIAAHFEHIQQCGGRWHDFLSLAHIAQRFAGPKSPLTQSLISQRDQALSAFRESCRPA